MIRKMDNNPNISSLIVNTERKLSIKNSDKYVVMLTFTVSKAIIENKRFSFRNVYTMS